MWASCRGIFNFQDLFLRLAIICVIKFLIVKKETCLDNSRVYLHALPSLEHLVLETLARCWPTGPLWPALGVSANRLNRKSYVESAAFNCVLIHSSEHTFFILLCVPFVF